MVQALPGLRGALPEERGDGSSAPSNESSCSLPAIPNDDGRELQQANHTPWLAGAAEQGNACSKVRPHAQSYRPAVCVWCVLSRSAGDCMAVTGELMWICNELRGVS